MKSSSEFNQPSGCVVDNYVAAFHIKPVKNKGKWEAKVRKIIKDSNLYPLICTHWLAYPNLKEASAKLLGSIGDWAPDAGAKPQILKAIELATDAAIQTVREGNSQAKVVTGCYLFKLAEVAAEIVTYSTRGIGENIFEETETWSVGSEDIYDWSRRHNYKAARTEKREHVGEDERRGVMIKLLSNCASARDVGIALRYEHFL